MSEMWICTPALWASLSIPSPWFLLQSFACKRILPFFWIHSFIRLLVLKPRDIAWLTLANTRDIPEASSFYSFKEIFQYYALQRKAIYVFLFWELRGLSPDFHIHVPVSDLYIPRIGSHISCKRISRSIEGRLFKSLTDNWMWKLGLCLGNSFSGNIYFQFSIFVLSVCGISQNRAIRCGF